MGPPSSSRRTVAARALGIVLVATIAVGAGCTSNDTVATGSNPTLPAASSPAAPSSTERTTTTKKAKTTTTEASSDDTDTTGSKGETTEPAGRGPDEIDACDLLTEEDVADAFGDPVTPAEDQSHDECWWYGPNDLKTANLIRRTGEDLDTWRSGYDNDSWEPVDRGDEGYAGKVLDSIVFRIDDTVFEVNVVYSTKGDPEQAVTELTDAVLAHLGR